MKTTTSDRAILVVGFILIAFNGLFLFGNGIFMLVAPIAWYNIVPGVTHTGSFNQHFIRDIGLVQMFLGAGFVIGMLQPRHRFDLWAVGTSWLIAHASFHLWEVAVGISSPSTILQDFPTVTLPAVIGVVLTGWAWRTSPRSTSFV